MEIMAFIPARSGSKSIKDKNIKELNKHPLIAHSIMAALQSKYIKKVMVSTDSKIYAEHAEKYGAWVPFLRTPEVSNDDIHAANTIQWTLMEMTRRGISLPDIVVMLLPTSPLRKTESINGAIDKFLEGNCKSVVSVYKTTDGPEYLRKIDNGFLNRLDYYGDKGNFQRQDLPDYYKLNGSIYVMKTEEFIESGTFHGDKICPYVMPYEESIDINYEIDFKLAKLLMEERDGK